MDSLWQSQRPGHGNDDIHRWRYQQHGVSFSPPSDSPSNDGGSDMDYDYLSGVMGDYSSGALGGSV